MPDQFQLWKDAKDKKEKAKAKCKEAADKKLARENAFDLYNMTVDAYLKWGKDGADREEWIAEIEKERKLADDTLNAWAKASKDCHDAEDAAIAAVAAFNAVLPPGVPLMPY